MQRTWIVSFCAMGLLGLSLNAAAQQPQQQPQEPQPQQQPGQQPPQPGQPGTPPPSELPHEQPAPPPMPEPAAEVTDEDLDTFAAIYSGLMKTASKFEEEITAADSVEEVQEAQERMRDESIAAIEAEGWTLDMYNSVAQAINANPELAQEALRRIEEREQS
jgi:hypothetical protein